LNVNSKKNGISSNSKILIIVCIVLVIGLGITTGILLKNSQQTPDIATQNQYNSNSTQISKSTGFPVSEAPNMAEKIYNSNVTIKSITFNSITLDKNQCIYILAKSIVMINDGNQGNIPLTSFNSADYPEGYITNYVITKSEYVDMAHRTYTWMDKNGATPNYVGIKTPGQPDLSPDSALKMFAKVLSTYKSEGNLPNSITIP
jgi:hypothetical protein